MEADEGLYKALPQVRGTIAHETVDKHTYSSLKTVITSMTVYSPTLRLIGKIDLYKQNSKTLIERKYQFKNPYEGQIYQLWAQYFCMIEMGYEVEHLVFHATASNRTVPIILPHETERKELESLVSKIRNYEIGETAAVSRSRCQHCIYCNMCDKTIEENVYV